MFWLILAVLGTVLLSSLAFTLGAALGASVSHEQFMAIILPALGAMGGWVSGVGALGAVLATLWMAERQRRVELPQLDLSISGSYTFRFVNQGRLPVTVCSIDPFLTSRHGTSSFVCGFDSVPNSPDRAILGFGETVSFVYSSEMIDHIAEWVRTDCGGDVRNIRIIVSTPVRVFEYPLCSYMQHHLSFAMKRVDNN